MSDEPDDDDEIIACWCGASGTCEELFDDSDEDEGCGGSGMIQCFCGGDQCVCHNHGEYECSGCDDCGIDIDDDDWDGDDQEFDW
jgi:hypothetical protein